MKFCMFNSGNFLIFLLASVISMPALALDEIKPQCVPLAADLAVDQIWGGTTVGFSAIENQRFIYIGYYDDGRWLTVSQIEKCTGKIKKVRLPSQFIGWDSHNYVALALDDDGRLHISGNMHASPMVYAHMSRPNDLDSLQELRVMVGSDELRTTYPKFFRLADGALGFSYRTGESGNGKEIINRFDGRKWSRWLDKPLFASENSTLTVNAYHTDYTRKGPDGFFHVAWVWRDTSDVETNFYVNYAKSYDLKHWTDSMGKALELPLTPKNSEILDPVPQKGGLLNNVKLGFDERGRVVISYLKFDVTGATQLYQVRRETDGWKIYQSTNWTYRWELKGGGTIVNEIAYGPVIFKEGMLLQRVQHPEIGHVTLNYRSADMKIQKVLKDYSWEQPLTVKRQAISGVKLNVQSVMNINNNYANVNAISWYSLPNDTRDRKRECDSRINNCNYLYELQLNTGVVR